MYTVAFHENLGYCFFVSKNGRRMLADVCANVSGLTLHEERHCTDSR
jgi:hypothetical protein